jgi:hypothetical protein
LHLKFRLKTKKKPFYQSPILCSSTPNIFVNEPNRGAVDYIKKKVKLKPSKTNKEKNKTSAPNKLDWAELKMQLSRARTFTTNDVTFAA